MPSADEQSRDRQVGRRRRGSLGGLRYERSGCGLTALTSAQLLQDQPRTSRPFVRLLGQQGRDQAGEPLGGAGAKLRDQGWRFQHHLTHQPWHGRAGEWEPSGRHLEQHHPKRIEIGLPIGALPDQQLGGHVGERAQHQSGRGRSSGLQVPGGVAHHFREPEIHHLYPAVGGDHHVAGFQVAVQHPARVCGLQRRDDRNGELHHLIRLEASWGDQLLERAPLHQLHDHERDPIGLAHSVDGDHVGMVHRGERDRFPVESSHPLRMTAQHARQPFDRHPSPQRRVLGEEDLAHAALPQLCKNPELAQGGTDHSCPSCCVLRSWV